MCFITRKPSLNKTYPRMCNRAVCRSMKRKLPPGSRFCECPICHARVAIGLINEHMDSSQCAPRRTTAIPPPPRQRPVVAHTYGVQPCATKASSGVSTCNGGVSTCNGGVSTCNGGVSTCNGGAQTCNGGAPTCNGGAPTCHGGAPACHGGSAFALLMRAPRSAPAVSATTSMPLPPVECRMSAHKELQGLWLIEAFISSEEEGVCAEHPSLRPQLNIYPILPISFRSFSLSSSPPRTWPFPTGLLAHRRLHQ